MVVLFDVHRPRLLSMILQLLSAQKKPTDRNKLPMVCVLSIYVHVVCVVDIVYVRTYRLCVVCILNVCACALVCVCVFVCAYVDCVCMLCVFVCIVIMCERVCGCVCAYGVLLCTDFFNNFWWELWVILL